MIANLKCPPPVSSAVLEPEPEEEELARGDTKPTKKGNVSPPKAAVGSAKTTEKVADKKTGKKTYGPYKAGEFRKLYREFIEAEKASGKSWKDANKAWQMSSKRADLWAEMPTPEKKKRRFV